MNRKLLPVVAAFLILAMLFGSTPFTYAVTTVTFGPNLAVTTIPQDNQKLGTGVMVLGIDPANPTALQAPLPNDLLSQHKLLVTYNGQPIIWSIEQGTTGVSVVCNVVEKDKINVVPDPKTDKGKQGSWENLMTTLQDVSDKFVCKPRWKSPTPGYYQSDGVLDVYYVGPLPAAATGTASNGAPIGGATGLSVAPWIADYIVVVEAFITIGRTVIFGVDIQDICVLGWAVEGPLVTIATPDTTITKPDGTQHWIWTAGAMGSWVSCDELALAQRDVVALKLLTGQDPLSPV